MDKRQSEFDRTRLRLESLSKRRHNLTLKDVLPLQPVSVNDSTFEFIADKIHHATEFKSAVILMMGAHVVRAGVQRYLIDLMQKGFISCIALSGAGIIHDFEYALIGATTESVAEYINDGRFGLWQETGRINEIVSKGCGQNLGLGEAVGKAIETEKFPYREISIAAAGYRLGIPITVHVGIGYDIVHEHPNCDGAAYGKASYTDFLRFARVMQEIEGGVVMNFGSAVMAPEVYLKALAMARNIAFQENRRISNFSTLVCDLVDLPANIQIEPSPQNPSYYFRPWKTMLVRTVSDGGQSRYICGHHRKTLPQLWTAVTAG
jgi:hypothetical protein